MAMLATTTPPASSMLAPVDGDGAATERAIVVAAQRGSGDAFSALVRIHQRRAYSVVRAIVLSHEDAEDAVQEGFLHAHRALDRFRPDQPRGVAYRSWRMRRSISCADVRGADRLSGERRAPRDPRSRASCAQLQEALTHLTDRQRGDRPARWKDSLTADRAYARYSRHRSIRSSPCSRNASPASAEHPGPRLTIADAPRER